MEDAKMASATENVSHLTKYLLAAAGVAATSLVIKCLPGVASIPNISMLYLLSVMIAALRLGRLPSIFSALLSFFAFDFFFVKPFYSVTVSDPSEWIALCVFLFASLVISQLTSALKSRMEEAQRSRKETEALAEASWAVAVELDSSKALLKVLDQIKRVLDVEHAAVVTVQDRVESAESKTRPETLSELVVEQSIPQDLAGFRPDISREAVDLVFRDGRPIGLTDRDLWDKALVSMTKPKALYLPATMESEVLGVIYLKLKKTDEDAQQSSQMQVSDNKQVLQSLANNAAVVLQRDRVVRLQAKAEALAEADRLKTALLSMVSHDFRSPLTSIKANVGNLLADTNTVTDDGARQMLESIEGEADRLNKLVGNILDLSRLESNAWKPKKEIAEVIDIVGPALDALSQLDNGRIDVKIEPGLHEVMVDSVQLTQVLRNLLENALKYSPKESRIELSGAIKGDAFEISVKDRGSGLPPGAESKIFEPFYRAPNLRESSIPGMGVGLAVCRGLVEANGGKISALNRQGGGSVFTVTVQLAPETEPVISSNQRTKESGVHLV